MCDTELGTELGEITDTIVDIDSFWDVPTDFELAEFMDDLWLNNKDLDKWFDSCSVNEANTSHFPTDIDLNREVDLLGVVAPSDLDEVFESEVFNAAVERVANQMDVEPVPTVCEVEDVSSDEDSGEEYVPSKSLDLRKVWTRKKLHKHERKFLTHLCKVITRFRQPVSMAVLHVLWGDSTDTLARFIKSNRSYIRSNGGSYSMTKRGIQRFQSV